MTAESGCYFFAQIRTAGFSVLPPPEHCTFRSLLDSVAPEEWEAVNQKVHAAIQPYAKGDAVDFGVKVVLASGTK